jgi:hypothetical protein
MRVLLLVLFIPLLLIPVAAVALQVMACGILMPTLLDIETTVRERVL